MALVVNYGASDGIQTRGLFLGKEALYQLSYTRILNRSNCKIILTF